MNKVLLVLAAIATLVGTAIASEESPFQFQLEESEGPRGFAVVASRVMWKINGAFFRLVKCTTSRPPWQAATGGTRHGQRYQQVGRRA